MAESNDRSMARIAAELRAFLRRAAARRRARGHGKGTGGARVRGVLVAGGSTPPPQLAYMVNFPRLSVTLAGQERVELEQDGHVRLVAVRAGHALFVPANCWNRPTWSTPARVLTFLFGKRQTGISLVTQRYASRAPDTAIKTHLHLPVDGPAPGILDALINYARHAGHDGSRNGNGSPAGALLVEALLHCCLDLLEDPPPAIGGKADRTFHNICLYVQENFQFPLSRDSVADHFRLSPNHVSRLFCHEGLMKFNEYVTWVRLDRAKFLLRQHVDLTLDEVARSCGFGDTGYFCRVFKKRTKMTPSAYRGAPAALQQAAGAGVRTGAMAPV
jgi:AraC-like DNA-binding protein